MLDELQWIVVPGGPGLSNSYLRYALEKIPIACKLHFYDVYGSPESDNKNPSLNEMTDQIDLVANKNNLSEYGLITHSFGNYLVMRAFQKSKGSIKAIIMLNPIPYEFHAWKEALSGIIKRVPETIFKEMISLSSSDKPDAGVKLFRLIFRYYVANRDSDLPVEVPFDSNVCNTIAGKVPKYNDKELVSSASIPIVRIVGGSDLFFDDHKILLERTIILPKVGHYPFFGDPDSFYKAIRNAGELLCQQMAKMTKKC